MLDFKVSSAGPRVAAISAAKMLFHPLAVGMGFAIVFGPDSLVLKDAVLFASMPLFLSFVVFASKFSVGEVASSAIVVSTLIAAISVPALLSILF